MKAEQLFDISGQIAFVTGAASGLGLAMAEVMAANGAQVTLADVDAAALDAAVARLRAAGFAVEGAVVDVADRDRVHQAVDEAASHGGRLDIVFANAGISAGPGFTETVGRIENVARDAWDKVLQINLTGVFTTIQAAARHMKAQGSGRIIVTSSIAGLRAEPPVGYAYAATKAAVANLVRQAALELAPFNVLVNGIAPGPFLTNIADGRLRREPERHQEFAASVPLKRLAQPDEIKGLALLLASPAGSFITGAVIPIDGGSTAG
jgi:NAD(P)-dependent dehydrogenase (short-subunit alcohol dehydrogenase family)